MSDILEKIKELTELLLQGTDMFIVHLKMKPVNNIKLYIDADEGMSISKSASLNRKLYKLIEEAQMFQDGDFSLEVSSPGVDEPLVSQRQYKKNIGRTVLISLPEDKEVLGVLKEVKEDALLLETKQGKKKEIVMVEVPFSDIKKIVVQIIF
ncbi:MAG: ribosome maturation factor [Bacteroidetes bacterium]|nr:ribosome maturation factor [Bacteroidota bacterium]